jgi:site-specific recombinase XerD
LEGYKENLRTSGMALTSLLSRVRNLRQAVLAMDEKADLRLISTLCSKVKGHAEPVRQKELRIVPTDELVDLALQEYDTLVSSSERLAGRACDRLRDALMMALLALRPLRLATFAGLTLGQHLIREGDGYRLRLESEEPKEKVAFESFLPEMLVPYLEHYCTEVRPQLLHGQTSDRLWVSMRGTGMSESSIYYQICKITKRLVGHPINPHAFRDCLLTTIATDAPKSVRAGARLLGHRDLRTGEAHYNFATQRSAQQLWVDILRKKRTRVG